MPKNIVVFSDGTGQDGGVRPEQRVSNVYKLYRACRSGPDSDVDPVQQVSFYDPGLGTDIGATALTAPVRFIQKLLASVIGRGITRNIADCYEFIINHYEPGDRIFLFGFSRGAYTVRCVANLLRLCGVPTRTPTGPLPLFRKATRDIANEAVLTVFEHGAGHPRDMYEAERDELAHRFRTNYGSDHESGETKRSNVAPHFVGVFDTAAALGASGLRRWIIIGGFAVVLVVGVGLLAAIPAALVAWAAHAAGAPFWWTLLGLLGISELVGLLVAAWKWRSSVTKTIRDFPSLGDVRSHRAEWKGENFDRLLSRFVHYARSANAIDETRKDFARVGWGGMSAGGDRERDGHERLVQLWFAGNHSDVGGSYPETESRLSDIALEWMVTEATGIPDRLILDATIPSGGELPVRKLRTYPSSGGVQHCEVAGMRDTIETMSPRWLLRFTRSLGYAVQVRPIKPDAPVHDTVVERFALTAVRQCAGFGPYRPAALAGHNLFKDRYPAPSSTSVAKHSDERASPA